MRQTSDRTKQLKSATKSIGHPLIHSQTGWNGIGSNKVSEEVLDFSSSRTSVMSTNEPEGNLGIKVFELQTSVGNKNGEPKTTRLTKSGFYENCKQEYLNFSTAVSPTMGEPLRSDPRLALIGHSIAFSEYPCSEPYSWGSSPANVQPWSDVQDLNHPRMALPLQIAEEPVYVNAKQYHGILRRRQLRAKAELENKVSKVKKVGSSRVPYLHESRHLHALRRARGCGGRFLSSKKNATSNRNNATSERGTNLNAGVSADGHISMCSHDSTNPRSTSGNVDFSGGCEELQGEYKTRMFSNGVITINGIPSSFHL